MMNYGEIFLKAGTKLVCPKCKWPQAELLVDILSRNEFDWRAIRPYDRDSIVGVSSCCNERYVTFDCVFYTEFGAI